MLICTDSYRMGVFAERLTHTYPCARNVVVSKSRSSKSRARAHMMYGQPHRKWRMYWLGNGARTWFLKEDVNRENAPVYIYRE